ncbi:MAG: hypothetical protein AVDCRST_MAG26-2755, partial [uncultured Chloroflexia bacterium]
CRKRIRAICVSRSGLRRHLPHPRRAWRLMVWCGTGYQTTCRRCTAARACT